MNLDEATVQQFQKLYRDRYGTDIPKDKACEQIVKLVTLLRRIYAPMTKARFDEIQEYRRTILPEIIHRISHGDDPTITTKS